MKTEREIKTELDRLRTLRHEREGVGLDYHELTSAISAFEWVLEYGY